MSLATEFLDITGSEIPISKTYSFDGITYTFRFKENKSFNFFTVEIFDATGEIFLYSNKLVYGRPIMDSTLAPFLDKIIPLNIARLQTGKGTALITKDTLGGEIKLYTSIVEVE